MCFGERGIEGKIAAAGYAREHEIPCLGLCLGLQMMVIEFARDALGLAGANSTEVDRTTPHPVIDLMDTQREVVELRFPDGAELNGKLDDLGERVEVLANRVLIGTDNGDATAHAVHERGIVAESVLVRRSTLEDVFLTLTGRTLVD